MLLVDVGDALLFHVRLKSCQVCSVLSRFKCMLVSLIGQIMPLGTLHDLFSSDCLVCCLEVV